MPWSRESRHKRGYGTAWDKLRKRILARDKHLCQPCFRKGIIHPGNEVDHRLPKAQGGTDNEDNLQAINRECHKVKTALENGAKPKVSIGLDGWPQGGGD